MGFENHLELLQSIVGKGLQFWRMFPRSGREHPNPERQSCESAHTPFRGADASGPRMHMKKFAGGRKARLMIPPLGK